MGTMNGAWRRCSAGGFLALLGTALISVLIATRDSRASLLEFLRARRECHLNGCEGHGCAPEGLQLTGEPGGTWYWQRTPEDERQVVASLFNRYCIRCHGVDGRGVWDIPGIPDFTNARWQACRSDGQLARIILEGQGAVMPPFRGTLTLEEAWAMARYLRTFVPGTETPRPDLTQPQKEPLPPPTVVPMKPAAPSK
jgi:mono/diheme cytochrome c family protein